MFSNSLNRILNKIIKQPEWEAYREYSQVVKCWHKVVNQQALKNSKPLYIERNVLNVATSSAVWAQELALQRYSLLKRLNSRIDFTIKDIRFSPARWHNKPPSEKIEIPLQEVNLSKLRANQNQEQKDQNINADLAIRKWLQNKQQNAPQLATCPQCQSLTPPSELNRWQVCRYCIAQKWHDEYRPPN